MSGVEIVGLLASASQLFLYSIEIIQSILQIRGRSRDTPRRSQQHVEHIRQPTDTAWLIQRHHSLQTINIDTQVRATLKQVKTMSAVYDQVTSDNSHGPVRTYCKILRCRNEDEILANLGQLEKGKSSLLLCISMVHTDMLDDIQGGVGKLIKTLVIQMPER